MKTIRLAALMALLVCTSLIPIAAQQKGGAAWTFAVSGDSRNCGDVVMPSIAAAAAKDHAAFYWHLGDLRAIYGVDEDYQHDPEHRGKIIAKDDYLKDAWDDLGRAYAGLNNHEEAVRSFRKQIEP